MILRIPSHWLFQCPVSALIELRGNTCLGFAVWLLQSVGLSLRFLLCNYSGRLRAAGGEAGCTAERSSTTCGHAARSQGRSVCPLGCRCVRCLEVEAYAHGSPEVALCCGETEISVSSEAVAEPRAPVRLQDLLQKRTEGTTQLLFWLLAKGMQRLSLLYSCRCLVLHGGVSTPAPCEPARTHL